MAEYGKTVFPVVAKPPLSSSAHPAAPSLPRIAALDLARGLAVFGMYAAHLGPDPADGGLSGGLVESAVGRAPALFGLLAGATLVIIMGRGTPKTGRAHRQAIVKVVIRSLVLVALGTALAALGTDIDVILAFYGLYFLLALPFVRMRAVTLAAVATGLALIGPQLLYVLRNWLWDSGVADSMNAHDPLARAGGDGLIDLLFTGEYPAVTWMPFVLAGMAIGRLDLGSVAVHRRLAVLGPALAVLGYGSSWLALRAFPQAGFPQAWWSDAGDYNEGAVGLLVAVPHSQTTLSIIGSAGVAIAVLAAALMTVDRLSMATRLATPVIAVGTMPLTMYSAQILAVYFMDPGELPGPAPLATLLTFIVAAMVLAMVWRLRFPRGPLESVVNQLTRPAQYVR